MLDDYKHWAAPIAVPAAAELADRYAIGQLPHVYALGIDMRDLELVLSCFDEDGEGDGAAGKWPLHEYLRKTYAGASSYRATQHTMLNQHIHIDGDEALMWTYGVAYHIQPEGVDLANLTVGVHYRDLCRRTAGGWIVHRRKAVLQWADGPLPARR